MSHRFYSEINLHLTWHTKDNRPALSPEIEKTALHAIRRKAESYRGVIVHAVNGTEDHVHAAVSIPPTVLISEFVGQLKGYSSHEINQAFAGKAEHFDWQPGYGVVCFGTQHLPWVIRYIENQKQHHARKTIHERLERCMTEEDAESENEEAP